MGRWNAFLDWLVWAVTPVDSGRYGHQVPAAMSRGMYHEVLNWCHETLGNRYRHETPRVIWFKTEKEMLLFRLVWSEYLSSHQCTPIYKDRREIALDVMFSRLGKLTIIGVIWTSMFLALT